MKFSSALQFNAVSDWWDEYIAYDALKKCIYQLEKRQTELSGSYHDLESSEHTSLIPSEGSTDSVFVPLVDAELRKVSKFYEVQEKELLDEVANIENQVQTQDEVGLNVPTHYVDGQEYNDDDDDDDDESRSRTHSPPRRRQRKSSSATRYSSRFGTGGSATIPEEPPLSPGGRRYSTASSDDGADLEASVASFGPQSPSANNTSRSPMRVARALATKFNIVKDSWNSTSAPESIWTSKSSYAYDTRLLFKRKITNLYISLASLRSYVEVNYSGFRKILKKYDKVTYSELKDRYLHEKVENGLPFTPASRDKLAHAITRLQSLYAKCVTKGDRALALQQLKLHQRENIAWERDTVWRQMIGHERRGDADGPVRALGATLLRAPARALLEVPTPAGRIRITKSALAVTLAAAVFVVLLNVECVPDVTANRCFAILVFSTIMWATEAIPLFVTSLFVPFLLITLQVIRSKDGDILSTPEATQWVFSTMFSPTIMLLIGGFTISSALSKTNIDRMLITRVLTFAGTRPSSVLLAFMAVSCFASMWISNVAAPTLCFTLTKPILRNLPPKSAFAPALILAIALAANIGGQSSPISSPQNLIALHDMDPQIDWAKWFAVALPVSAISVILIWLLLLASYRPARSPDGEGYIEIKSIRPSREPFTGKQYWVAFVCILTIVLWCIEHSIESLVGDMGVIAIIPVVAFFATGVLKKDDFEQFAWTIVFLAMGGIALGKGVTDSGLLSTLDGGIRNLVDGLELYTVVLVLSPIVLVISTFISHTIASVLLVPIAKEVGGNLPGSPANLLIFITALICSAGMGMPVSGFPNQTAATQEDELGELYLTNVDFLKNGVPASIIATLIVATVGFLLMRAVGV